MKRGHSTILGLTAENVKRLSVVQIQSDGSPVVVIAGENEAGKSSVLDAIEMALGGKNHQPSKPIREGQSRAEVRLDLGDYIVTRTFTPTGGSLVVTNREGLKFPSPQALLDGLVGTLTFDPLAFASMDDKVQPATLRQLAGVDTTDLDLERKRVFDERTLVNRDMTQLQGALAKAPQHADVGVDLADAGALVAALNAADEVFATATKAASYATQMSGASQRAADRVRAANEAVTRAQKALEDAETASLEADEALHGALTAEQAAKTTADVAARAVPDRAALRQQIADIDALNGKVRDNLARARLAEQVAEKKAAADALSAHLTTIDTKKTDQLAAATFPVKGLGLDEAGVTWNGLPFAQASTAVRVRASVAIGLALNPTLKVLLVRNGNDLGTKNLALLADMAQAAGAQLWIERIAGADGHTTIVIDDGTVVERREAVRA